MSRLLFLQDKLGKNGLRVSVLELSYIKLYKWFIQVYLKQIRLLFELCVLKIVFLSKPHGTKSCTFSTDSVTVVIKVIYLHNTQTNVIHRDQEDVIDNWKPPIMISITKKTAVKEKRNDNAH